MKKLLSTVLVGLVLLLCSCQRTPSQVVDKVLVDFGVREQPEGHVSGADRVFERLAGVGRTEIKRLNQEVRHGEVKFQEEKGLRGKYYKEVTVFEDFHPLDAQATSRTSDNDRGFVGYIEYSYRKFQSVRTSGRTEAAAQSADIPTDQTGSEVYRYRFGPGGEWDGTKGEKVRR